MSALSPHVKKVVAVTHAATGTATFGGMALLPTIATQPLLCLLMSAFVVLTGFICSRVRAQAVRRELPDLPAQGSPPWRLLQQEYAKEFSRQQTVFLCLGMVSIFLPLLGILAETLVNVDLSPSVTRVMARLTIAVISGIAFGVFVGSQQLRFLDFIQRRLPH